MNRYKLLIANLPVRQQCFTTKRTTWKNVENRIEWLKQLNDDLFGDNKTLTINRQDIFDTTSLRELIIKTIYWGYTGGMRGNNFINILEKIDLIETAIKELKNKPNPNTNDFNKLKITFENVKGLGLSTYSKLLYFSDLTFNNYPCLILDQRLINVFKDKTYSEYDLLNGIRYSNAAKKYLDYLQLTNRISKDLETNGENIEQFLFIFGNNIKE
jgi:hypothetical protein